MGLLDDESWLAGEEGAPEGPDSLGDPAETLLCPAHICWPRCGSSDTFIQQTSDFSLPCFAICKGGNIYQSLLEKCEEVCIMFLKHSQMRLKIANNRLK